MLLVFSTQLINGGAQGAGLGLMHVCVCVCMCVCAHKYCVDCNHWSKETGTRLT